MIRRWLQAIFDWFGIRRPASRHVDPNMTSRPDPAHDSNSSPQPTDTQSETPQESDTEMSEPDPPPSTPNVPIRHVEVGPPSPKPPSADNQPSVPQTEASEGKDDTPAESVAESDSAADADAVPARDPDTTDPTDPPPPIMPADPSDATDPEPQESKGTDHNPASVSTKPPIDPIDAPGRRSVARQPRASPTRSRRTPRPELICRRNAASSTWQVLVAAEDGLRSVLRHDLPLTIERGECRLDSFAGALSVSSGDAEPSELSLLDNSPVAIFKLGTNWRADGRKVERVTSGHYIVIAPHGFTQTGHVPHENEPCDDDQYSAFYLHSGQHDDATEPLGFLEHPLAKATRGFQLLGKSLFDCSDMGPLFVDAVPELHTASNIVWARVGEEREGGWRGANFKPQETTLGSLMDGRQGRFYVRVYDSSKLVDSGEFRYVRDLRDIRINDEPFTPTQVILPAPHGHAATTVSLVGQPGVELQPRLADSAVHATANRNTILVEPHPDADHVACLLPLKRAFIEVVLDLPRVWWRLELEDETPTDWQATPCALTRHRFRQLAMSNASICLRLPTRTRSIRVGLDEEIDRTYRKSAPQDFVTIPLIDFNDYEQLDGQPHDQLTMNARLGDAVTAFLIVTADPLPEILSFECVPLELVLGQPATLHWTTRNANNNGVVIEPDIGRVDTEGASTVSPRHTTNYTLRLNVTGGRDVSSSTTLVVLPRVDPGQPGPTVKCFCGWRPGKGFSQGELRLAGLDSAHAAIHGLRIDKRRRTTHRQNAKIIQELIDAQ